MCSIITISFFQQVWAHSTNYLLVWTDELYAIVFPQPWEKLITSFEVAQASKNNLNKRVYTSLPNSTLMTGGSVSYFGSA